MGESSGVAERDWSGITAGVSPRRSPSGIGESTTLTIAYLHQQENNRPDAGIPFLDGEPAPVPRGAYYGLLTDHATFDDIGTVRFRHEFGTTRCRSPIPCVTPTISTIWITMPNFGDDPPAPGTPLMRILVGRDAPGSSGIADQFHQSDGRHRPFSTGPVKHDAGRRRRILTPDFDIDRYDNPFNSDNDWIPETPLL